MKDIEDNAAQKLQMPPVIKAQTEEPEVLSLDYELQGHSETKFVFTDISFDVSDRVRYFLYVGQNIHNTVSTTCFNNQ
jgi:hypothetical protein